MSFAHLIWAAPHTRGSTPPREVPGQAHRGCPAHAGIDPTASDRARLARRLPRTRGDRPARRRRWIQSTEAAPHTRGSTHGLVVFYERGPGCPAHAGIDPDTLGTSIAQSRLPRTRGDRPPPPAPFVACYPAAPHTRGSTLHARGLTARRSGCPAHAGIDRGAVARVCLVRRLPRTRGDRPSSRGRRWP